MRVVKQVNINWVEWNAGLTSCAVRQVLKTLEGCGGGVGYIPNMTKP